MSAFKDIDGMRFGLWTVLSLASIPPAKWNCVCDCGTERAVFSNSLLTEKSTNCGCVRREGITERNTTHGASRRILTTDEYNCWRHMNQRCHNPKSKDFHYYGARGISVCDRWRNSFTNFLEDMGTRERGLTIDRIEVNGNYEPGNCKWATRAEQNVNRRKFKQPILRGAAKLSKLEKERAQ